jgi:hypothetical protein
MRSRCGAKEFFQNKLGEPPPEQTPQEKKLMMTALFFVFSYHTPLLFPYFYFFNATDSAPPTNKLLRSEIREISLDPNYSLKTPFHFTTLHMPSIPPENAGNENESCRRRECGE